MVTVIADIEIIPAWTIAIWWPEWIQRYAHVDFAAGK
jgi:hypothetical protein